VKNFLPKISKALYNKLITNKYLQVLREKLISPKAELLKIGSSSSQASTSKQLEKPLINLSN